MALPFLVYLHPIAGSPALEIAARRDVRLGSLGWSSATAQGS